MGEWIERARRWHARVEARILGGRAGRWSTRRRYVMFVVVPLLVFCCCGGVVGVPAAWVLRETLDAGKAAVSPDAAASDYLTALGYGQRDGLLPILDDDHQDDLMGQWEAYRHAMETTDPAPARFDFGSLAVRQLDAGRAEVTTDVTATWWETDSNGRVSMYDSEALPWRIETRKTSRGWVITAVQAPAWCGGYVVRCGPRPSVPAASSTPDVSPSPSEDLLQGPREMLPCASRDPFRELHSCPPS